VSDYIELKPTFDVRDGAVVNEGDKVLVRGIGNRLLGVGSFAGSIVLAEADGTWIDHPVIEVQGRLVGGGQVDLWTTDPDIISNHRDDEVYPIELYLAEIAKDYARIINLMDEAQAQSLGVHLD
jgi:hypothetical protein